MNDMWILLSHVITTSTPSYNLGPSIEIEPYKLIARGDSSNSYLIKLYNHLGTHVDSPRHFDERGRAITDYKPEELIFTKPVLIDITKKAGEGITREDLKLVKSEIEGADALLIRTGVQKLRDEDPITFACDGVYLTPEAAEYIVEELNNLRALGLDAISISSPKHREEGRKSHKKLLTGRDFLIIEDMNLMGKPKNLKQLIISPIMIEGIDSSPCTVWAEI